ncbi:PH domain-containing protein [Streptomyces olivochromogenes]|uniref:PH domain-containing protein n=1 Tax=Streptomyces olivochromogenes TaxID=1963 RepID=UPI001F386AD5|nr:PH domain-containing protein [Streptomyces olivochromogenes]MCF3130793.1 PH domain-containing protein [Streptomyces olivochromogenes]
MLLFLRRGFTRVDTGGVVIHGAFRARRLPWSEIYELDVRQAPQANRAGAFVGTLDGRRRSLPQLNEWQVDGLRTPMAEQALRRRAGRMRSVSRAIVAALVTWLLMLALWLVLLATGQGPSVRLQLLWIPVAALVLFVAFFRWRWESCVPRERDLW